MSLVTWRYGGNVGYQYNGRELALLRESQVNCALYPISLTVDQFNAIPCRDQVFCILQRGMEFPLPSERARISNTQFASVRAIDYAFSEALNNYKRFLRSYPELMSALNRQCESTLRNEFNP